MLKDMNDEPRTDLTDRESDTSVSVTYSHDTEQHVTLYCVTFTARLSYWFSQDSGVVDCKK